MTFYIDIGAENEEKLRAHAEKLGQSVESFVNDAIRRLVEQQELSESKSGQTSRS